MENPSHSFRRNQASATFSRKFYNGKGSRGFAAKTVYDDVFGGPTKLGVPTFSPRVEDYCEIFGSFNASRASSIPSLDLPVVDGPELSFDVRCSNFDYSEVFGGFGSLDFAVSYEELLERSKRGYDSSDAAWTPSESEYLSEESDPSACAAMSQFFSNGKSFDEIMQFNDPYHKLNQAISEDMSKGMACTSHISSVSKITCVGDERSSFQKTEEKKTPLKVADDINVHMDVSRVMSGGKYFRKTKSLPLKNCSGPHTSGSDSKAQSGYCCDGAHPIETFVTVSDVSLTTCPSQVPPPSRLPPMLDFIKADFTRSASNLEASTNFAFEGTPDERFPPFLNVEVDASSSTAAMKDVMSKAQAKLKSAEQIMDRKEVLQNPMNLGSKDDVEDLEGKVGNVVDGSKKLVDDKVQEPGAVDDNEVTVFARKQTQVPIEMFDLDTDAIENEDLPAKVSANEKHEKDSEESYRTEGTGEWEEATEFYEIRTGLSRTAFEQVNNGNILVKKLKVHCCGEEAKISLEAFAQIEENDKAVVTKAGDWGKNEWTVGAGNEAREGNKIEDGTKEAESANSLQEHEKNDEVAKEDNEQKRQEKKLNSAWEHDKYEEKLVKVDKKEHGNLIGMHETEVKNALMQMDGNQKLVQASSKIELENEIDACRSGDVEKSLGETWKWERNEKRLNKGFKQAEPEKRLLEKEENKKTLKAVPGWAENENKEKLNTEKGENEQMLKESLEQEENEKKKEILQSEEDEKRLEEAFEQEENGKKLKEAIIKEERENKKVHAHVLGDSEKRLKETCEGEKLEKRLQEACGREEGEGKLQDIQGRKANEKKSTKAYECDKIEKRSKWPDKSETNEKRLEESGERIKLKSLPNVHGQSERDENEKKLKLAHKNFMPMEGRNLNLSDETFKLEDYTEVPCKHEVNNGKLGTNPVPCAHEGSGKIRVETKDGRTQLGAVKMAKKLSEEEFKAGMGEAYLEHGESQIRRKDAGKSTSNSKSFGSRQAQNRKANKTSVAFDSENLEKNSGQDGRGKSSSGAYLFHDQKNYENKSMSAHQVKEQVQIGRRTEAVESTVMQGRGNAQKMAQQVNMDHRKEKKITLTSEEREKEELMKREQELEKDRLRKMEEDMEREREREKDRMAVEIATHEAREGTFVEARERAERAAVERANAEAKQRALVEARERLVKACAEAREKSVADKVSMEARLRVERAAVERATAEAREHAVEKRMAEKAPYDTREKVERSFPDTNFASSRDNGGTWSSSSSDLQSMGYSSGSRHPYPSGYVGVEGESAQRCRARLERHQRTAERAAKALAEKNMRDLLAQREQAERTRLAETLDAEVKRWSNGKEGNLRALLSTLQYILGTGSGWQPIPLTDVITSVAVKKAYRKATLFVHPDKLQQRGASVQQKYICEKVFDLLKEAWNKFNSEER